MSFEERIALLEVLTDLYDIAIATNDHTFADFLQGKIKETISMLV